MEETYKFEKRDTLLDSGGVHSFARGGWLVYFLKKRNCLLKFVCIVERE